MLRSRRGPQAWRCGRCVLYGSRSHGIRGDAGDARRSVLALFLAGL